MQSKRSRKKKQEIADIVKKEEASDERERKHARSTWRRDHSHGPSIQGAEG